MSISKYFVRPSESLNVQPTSGSLRNPDPCFLPNKRLPELHAMPDDTIECLVSERYSNSIGRTRSDGTTLVGYPSNERIDAMERGTPEGGARKSAWRTRAQAATSVAANSLEDGAAWVYLDATFKGPPSAWQKPVASGLTWALSGFTRLAHFSLNPEERTKANILGGLSNGFAGVGDTVAAVLNKQGAKQLLITAAQQTGNALWCVSGSATVYDEAPRLVQHIREMREGSGSPLALTRSGVRTIAGLMQTAASVSGMAAKAEESAICWGLGSTGDTMHSVLGGLALFLKYLDEHS
jgi:hypothetical protein